MNTTTNPIHDADVVARFMAKVAEPDSNGCRDWTAARYATGYGAFWTGTGTRQANAVSLEIASGERSDGRVARHSCHRPVCVAPEHLQWGSHSDNARDCVEAGRNANANKTHCPEGHELTPENTYVYPSDSARECRICRAARAREIYVRAKQGLPAERPSNADKTHCKHGHEFTTENTYVAPGNGQRMCRECPRQRNREYAANRTVNAATTEAAA